MSHTILNSQNEVQPPIYWAGGERVDVKEAVRAATTANITLSGTQTIDGVVLVAGNRVLVKNQTLGQNNGIYDVSATAWTRAADANASAEVTSGIYVWVTEGTANGDNGYVLTTNDPITLGTTALTWVQFNGAGQVIAGNNITKSGNTISVSNSPTFVTPNIGAATGTSLTLSGGKVVLPTVHTAADASFRFTDAGDQDTMQIGLNLSDTLYVGKVPAQPQLYLGFEMDYDTLNYGGVTVTEMYFRYLIPNTSNYLEPYFNAINRATNVIEESKFAGDRITFKGGAYGADTFASITPSTGITLVSDGFGSAIHLTDSSGATFESYVTHTYSSPFRILTLGSKGGAGGWRGAINFDVSYNAGSVVTAMAIQADASGGANVLFGSNLATTIIGATLAVKSGANAKAGTFTLSSGTVTVSNTSITANSVVCCTVKTSSGTLGTGTPEIVINAGVGFTATGIATDNSIYNFVIFEVN